MRPWAKWLLVILIALVFSCGEPSRELNVIIIGVDTLRPDHLGCYGYQHDTSPNVDRLASQGILFENVVSQSPWTLPSFATVFTSLYPTQHGAGGPGGGSFGTRMRTSFPPLGMILLKRGYSTGAIINAPALSPEFAIDRGFEYYHTVTYREERIADQVTDDALDWIDLNKDGPFLLFVHYFDPHLSYSPPAPYDTLFDPHYKGRIGNSFDLSYFPRARITNFETMKVLTPADWNHIKSLYDGEIAFTDKAIGELLNGLRQRGLDKKTLIVFLSDHGEEFFEHEGFEHGHTLFDELIRVPLIFSLPGQIAAGLRDSHQVRLLDVAPTILDLLDITPTIHLEGVSLKPLLDRKGTPEASGAALLPPDFAYAERMLYGNENKSITAYPWKLIYDMATKEERLFNLDRDPGEMHNLIDDRPSSLDSVEEILFKTLLAISETWYVEMAGGEGAHTFDLEISIEQGPMKPRLSLYKVIDDEGDIVDKESGLDVESSASLIKIKHLKLIRPLTLAFKTETRRVSLRFDLRIDGKPATEATFLGKSLVQPSKMPFTQRGEFPGAKPKAVKTRGNPSTRPQPPYFVVWHSESEFKGDAAVTLSEDTKKQLRALGYIQ